MISIKSNFQAMMLTTLLSTFLFSIMISCIPGEASTSETQQVESTDPLDIQVYKMIDKDGARVIGEKSFHEQYVYRADGQKEAHLILDADGNIKAKEIYVYEGDKLVGSNYTSPDDSLLSYHAVLLDSLGNISVKKSFDGNTKELLRVETFDYLNGDELKIKKIHDSRMNLSRVFTFQHDEFGNELGFNVYDPTGIPLFGESYTITKMDDRNRWLEKTGYRDSIATTFKKRVIKK